MEKHPLHLKNPELQTSPEVQRAVQRAEQKTGEKVPSDSTERIEAYMDRLESIFLNPDERKSERNLEMFRGKIYDALIIKPEVAVDQILKDEAKVAFDRGHGRIEITEEMKNRPGTQEQADAVIKRQKASLDEWMDYLTSDDTSSYDPWFKYYLWNSIIKLQTLVKIERTDEKTGEKIITAEYPKRTPGTLKPFPDIFRGKLAQIYGKYNKYISGEKTDATAKEYFKRNFAKTYAEESLDHIVNSSSESKEQTHGKWVTYKKGKTYDAKRMIASLQDKYTDWCIEGEGVGKDKLNEGNIYIYYTFDKGGNPVDPRLCIRMSDDRIAEVRGISGGKSQEVEQVFMDEAGEGGSVLGNKLKEFGNEADAYRKRESDMKQVTRLMKKNQNDDPFTKEELQFLYEINGTIEGFGYQKDPRIAELRQGRNLEEDMLVVFECTRDEIAHGLSQINKNTKAYVGQLKPGIFQKLPESLEYVYTSFPEKKIQRVNVEIGGKSAEQLFSEMEAAHINISGYAKSMMENREFIPGKNREEVTLIRLTVADLGFKIIPTIDQINKRAQRLGLELCPPDTGPNYRLKYRNQPLGEWVCIGNKIADSAGYAHVFMLVHDAYGLGLGDSWAEPSSFGSGLGDKYVFRLPSPEAGKQV
jgi:hypothetical protein